MICRKIVREEGFPAFAGIVPLYITVIGRLIPSKESIEMRRIFSVAVVGFAVAILTVFGGCNGKSDSGNANSPDNAAVGDKNTDGNAGNQAPAPKVPPEVVLDITNYGKITLQLTDDVTPMTVKNFLKKVNEKFYDGVIFHRIFKDQAIVAGFFDENMQKRESSDIGIMNEADKAPKNTKYTVGMMRDQDVQDSATTVFFINTADNTTFDHADRTVAGYGYCVFGKVIAGQEIVDRIAAVEVQDMGENLDVPKERIIIKSAKQTK
jgi:peptidyl-prolyl cis-trans isomerase B (cyclophilin B)